jgi:four helix bundle protein
MAKIGKFQDLEAWKMARKITNEIYSISKQDKFNRDFALCNQIRRAAISILSNIAEGFERNGDKEFLQFLSIAKASCAEVYAQLYIALDQQYIEEMQFKKIADDLEEEGRIIGGLMKYLQQSEMRGSKFK